MEMELYNEWSKFKLSLVFQYVGTGSGRMDLIPTPSLGENTRRGQR